MSVHEDFHHDSRPLVAGQITGVRSFAVDKLGRLTGVTHTKVWRPGVNTAECPTARVAVKAADAAKAEREGDESIDWSDLQAAVRRAYLGSVSITSSFYLTTPWDVPTRTDEHRPGAKGCGCGFWAYFDGSDDFSGDDNITGVVHGSGVVTVGSKGFRSERAEIVALVDPGRAKRDGEVLHRAWDRWCDSIDRWGGLQTTVGLAGAVLGVFGAIAAGTQARWLLLAGLAVLAVVGLTMLVGAFVGINHAVDRRHGDRDGCPDRRDRDGLDRERWQAVRRNYPDVPVYPSLRAALRDFPLSEPPKPEPLTPDNTADFWERRA